ncbi:hypothetical protein J5289_21655 [Rhizobium sp. B230/85]|uniref:hypothetical protein n=1 Tax=unclassified Rhizobium TaxID=2613769 RepID=UPI001ADBD176|nr:MULTISPECIES: hypothetical protein [unclassified Rhizobium]MBO9136906.1 hypothetical protein [Rhizobium sp. B209b/85]QXZ99094.1 hypothetical protein J5289_21655 [Rhizobium sp. B230/85]
MDVWKIGVHIGMTNGMSPVLALIGADLLGLKGKVGDVEHAFTAWKPALAGALGIITGGAILEGMAKLVDHGQELVHVQQQLAAAGVDQVDVAKATADSWKVASEYGLKVSDVLADIKEARMVFGSTEHAMEFIKPLEQMRVVLNGTTEGSGNNAASAVYEMARAGELKGLQGPDQFVSYFDQMTKAITASGGKVEPKSFLQATQYGRLASKGWDEEFYTKILPSMIQEMGPSQSGTALMSLFGTVVQGKVTKRSLGQMIDLGMIEDPSKVIYDGKGDPVGFNPGAVKGTDLMTKDPYRWAQEVFRPLVEAKLGHEVKAGDESAISLIGGMFGNRTSAQAIATLLLESQRINKDASIIGGSHGLDAAPGLVANDPKTVQKNFTDSWDNLLTALGSPLVPLSISAMNSIADVVKSVTGVAAAHPEAVKIVGEAIVGLGLALAGLGAVAVLTAAAALLPGGAVVVAIVALGGIIASIVKFNWQGIKATLTGIYDAIADFINKMTGLVTNMFGTGAIPRPKDGAAAPTWQPPSIAPRGQNEAPVWSAPAAGGRGIHPTNWVPPANNNTPQVIHTALNVDGRRLATAVSQHMASNSQWSNSSSSFDGRAMPSPTDVSFI